MFTPAKGGKDKKKEHPISSMIRRIVWLLLFGISLWLYWQNVTLAHDNRVLTARLTAADKKLAHLHQKLPLANLPASSPIDAAQEHFLLAHDAFQRHDYATALKQLDFAQAALEKAASSASAQTRAAAKSISVGLQSLRELIKLRGKQEIDLLKSKDNGTGPKSVVN